jgi:hypothetical protein
MKIFCIGLPKTGTTSLGKAFDILGLSHNEATDSTLAIRDICNASYNYIREQISVYDAFEDTPYHLIYDWLHYNYPEAKFILTERLNEDKYLQSLLNESNEKKNSGIHQLKKSAQFGFPLIKDNEEEVKAFYLNHNKTIKERFDNVLVMNFEKGDSWKELCEFLELPIPEINFPHENKTKI